MCQSALLPRGSVHQPAAPSRGLRLWPLPARPLRERTRLHAEREGRCVIFDVMAHRNSVLLMSLPVFRSVQSPSTDAGGEKDGRRTEQQALHDPPAQHSHPIQTSVFCCCQSRSRQCPRPGSPFGARRRNWEERGGPSLKGRSSGIRWIQFQFPI